MTIPSPKSSLSIYLINFVRLLSMNSVGIEAIHIGREIFLGYHCFARPRLLLLVCNKSERDY